MFKMKRNTLMSKYRQISFLFVSFFLLVSSLFGQSAVGVIDSLERVQQDSLRKTESYNDSIRYKYVSIQSEGGHYYLDSLRALAIVNDNDFVGWMNRMNSLVKQKEDFEVMPSQEKYSRPIWVLVLIFSFIVSIGLIRLFFYNNFYNIVYGFYNNRVLAQVNREDSIATSWPYILLYIVLTLCLGLFMTMYRSYALQVEGMEFLMFLKISVGIALLFLLKIIVLRFLGFLFEVERSARDYSVFLFLFYFNSVLILLPLLLFVVFMPFYYFNYVLFLFIIIVCVLFFYRFLRILLSLIDGLRFSIFYLILYLCAVEIAPILILVKSLNN